MIDPKKAVEGIMDANDVSEGEVVEVSLSAGTLRGEVRIGFSMAGGMTIDEGEFERVRDDVILPAIDRRRVGNHADLGTLYVRDGEIIDVEIDGQYLRENSA